MSDEKLQIPSRKPQRNSKLQAPKRGARSYGWSLRFGASLDFGFWSLELFTSLLWGLGLGVWSFLWVSHCYQRKRYIRPTFSANARWKSCAAWMWNCNVATSSP